MIGLLIVVAVAALMAGAVYVACTCETWSPLEPLCTIAAALCGVALVFALIGFVANHCACASQLVEIEATRQTIAAARQDDTIIERAALTQTIASLNGWLAKAKYWNGGTWDYWIPDEVESVEPLR